MVSPAEVRSIRGRDHSVARAAGRMFVRAIH